MIVLCWCAGLLYGIGVIQLFFSGLCLVFLADFYEEPDDYKVAIVLMKYCLVWPFALYKVVKIKNKQWEEK